ncbi:MAG: hypothetical protein KC587_18150 [Nitrospira sp.]|nr:hypothetical protein [Nitrospira sp.]
MADTDEAFFNGRPSEFNCYAYATGDRCRPSQVGGLRPGESAAKPISKFTPFDLKNALIADGAVFAGEGPDIPPEREGMRLIGAAISPKDESHEGDFHFYRLDSGVWTHRPGKGLVSGVDAEGAPISNPALAKRDYRQVLINEFHWPYNYKYFVGYFYFPIKKLKCPERSVDNQNFPDHRASQPKEAVR